MAAAVGRINPIRYRGYYYDGETGYYYLQSRYYNPDICRFINADEPLYIYSNSEKSVFRNIFTYCENSPINSSDTTGNLSVKHFWNYINSFPLVSRPTNLAGFAWDRWQGIWYSLMYPAQRNFGYCDLYDTLAPLAGIFITHRKIPFKYSGKSWMIWLWKGRYGITSGAEIGLYVFQKRFQFGLWGKTYRQDWYRCAYDNERIKMSFTLYSGGRRLFSRAYQTHWWLTGFKPGFYRNLSMYITLGFHNAAMARAFCNSARIKFRNSSVVSFCGDKFWHIKLFGNVYSFSLLF